ncbi:MAG: hypothetical protein IAI50_17770, partial [Candidatus Eremiobacteraeota bacterium]|nr:hypothetical protein [Candidatus Eremiobacteraeota bacterium]
MIADSQTVFDLAVVRSWTWVIAGAISVAALYITRRHDNRYVPSRRGMACVAALLLVAWTWPQGLGRVQPGARGVVLRFGAPTGRTVDEGLYYVLPVAERVVQVNTQLNTLAVDRAQGTCSDLEPVYADVAVTFHVDPARAVDVYRSLRFDYAERLLRPAIS